MILETIEGSRIRVWRLNESSSAIGVDILPNELLVRLGTDTIIPDIVVLRAFETKGIGDGSHDQRDRMDGNSFNECGALKRTKER